MNGRKAAPVASTRARLGAPVIQNTSWPRRVSSVASGSSGEKWPSAGSVAMRKRGMAPRSRAQARAASGSPLVATAGADARTERYRTRNAPRMNGWMRQK